MRVERVERRRDLVLRAVALHARRGDQAQRQAGQAPPGDLEHVVQRGARAPRSRCRARAARAAARACAPRRRGPRLRAARAAARRRAAARPLPRGSSCAHHELQLAARLVDRELAVDEHLEAVLGLEAQAARGAAEQRRAQLRLLVLQREVEVARRRRGAGCSSRRRPRPGRRAPRAARARPRRAHRRCRCAARLRRWRRSEWASARAAGVAASASGARACIGAGRARAGARSRSSSSAPRRARASWMSSDSPGAAGSFAGGGVSGAPSGRLGAACFCVKWPSRSRSRICRVGCRSPGAPAGTAGTDDDVRRDADLLDRAPAGV